MSDISVTIDPIKREDGQEIKVDRTTKHSRTPPPLCDLLQPPRWFSFLTLGMSRSACLTSFTRWATLTLDFGLTAVYGGYNIERRWQRWWKICFFAVSVGQAVPNRRSEGAQSQLGAGKYGLEWLFHCHYRDRDIFLDLIYVAQQSSLILKLKMFFPTDAQRLPGPGMPILHQDDSRDEYQLHRREERQRRHWPRPPPGSGLKAPKTMLELHQYQCQRCQHKFQCRILTKSCSRVWSWRRVTKALATDCPLQRTAMMTATSGTVPSLLLGRSDDQYRNPNNNTGTI